MVYLYNRQFSLSVYKISLRSIITSTPFMKILTTLSTILFLYLMAPNATAQVGIGTLLPDGALDISSTNDGLLIPRVDLTSLNSTSPLSTPTTSELIYNTGITLSPAGFYYWDGSKWVQLQTTTSTSWNTTGNASLSGTTNFIGTTDAVDVAFRRSNTAAGKIGSTSTAFGVGALAAGGSTNSTAFGNNALAVSTGSNNVAFGQNALAACNTTAQWNTAMGTNALKGINNPAAQSNTAIGSDAMSLGTGNISNCVAIGYKALLQNTASNTTAIGYFALQGNTTQAGNTAVGWSSLNNAGGSANTALGYEAGFNAIGNNNVCIGYQTGRNANNATGNNTFIGYQAGISATGNNNIAIGFNTQVDVAANSNQIRLGDQNILLATTKVSWTTSSDKRWKDNITNSPLGLEFVKTLRPVSYIRKNDDKHKTEYGFIAQEVETAFQEAGDPNNGIVNKDDAGMYGLRYNDFIAITVKAIQEQQTQISTLLKENEELQKANVAILKRLEALEKNK
jgi:hypothetical protein